MGSRRVLASLLYHTYVMCCVANFSAKLCRPGTISVQHPIATTTQTTQNTLGPNGVGNPAPRTGTFSIFVYWKQKNWKIICWQC